jgi:hypothetical protein
MTNPHIALDETHVTGHQAYAHMHAYLLQHRNGFRGRCHKTCQDAWNLPVLFSGAIQAWDAIPQQHKHTDITSAPVGAPVFYSGGSYGHVALMSDKPGIVITTDAPVSDYIGEVPYDWFVKHWGKTYLGWASFYNGKVLNFNEPPKTSSPAIHYRR